MLSNYNLLILYTSFNIFNFVFKLRIQFTFTNIEGIYYNRLGSKLLYNNRSLSARAFQRSMSRSLGAARLSYGII